MGPVDAPVLNDMFGEEEGKENGVEKYFRYSRINAGYRVKSVKIYDEKCENCGHKLRINYDTEMDYKDETENHITRLLTNELEGR